MVFAWFCSNGCFVEHLSFLFSLVLVVNQFLTFDVFDIHFPKMSDLNTEK